MNRQKWLLGRVLAVTITAAAGCGAPEAESKPATAVAQAVDAGPLAARPDPVDLGKLPVGGAGTQAVSLVNTGTDDVDITSVRSTAAYPPDPCRPVLIQPCIRPGDSTTLAISCAPATAGPVGGTVEIAYHSGRVSYQLSLPYAGVAY